MADTTADSIDEFLKVQSLISHLHVTSVQPGIIDTPEDRAFTEGFAEGYAFAQTEALPAYRELAALARTNAMQQQMLVEMAHRVLVAERTVEVLLNGGLAR